MLDLAFLKEAKARKRIAIVALGLAVVGALYGWLGPTWYRSIATVVPAKPPAGGGLSSLLGGETGALAATLVGGGGGAPDTSRIAAVLQSNSVSDAVIGKFGLQERYDVGHLETARNVLWEHCNVRVLFKPSLVQVSCEDRDPRRARDMVAYFVEYGNEVFRRVSVSSASEEVRMMERRVADLRKEADEVAAQMRAFQEANQIVDLDSQARALVGSVAAVNAQRITKKMELDYARSFSARDEASTRQLESQISVMNEALRDLEVPAEEPAPGVPAAGAGRGGGRGLFPAALAVPKLRAEYEKLFRNRKVAEATLVFSLDRLEGARAAQARDVSTFQVLDAPSLPTLKSRPRIGLSALLGIAIGIVAGLGVEIWSRRRRLAGPAASAGQASG